MEQKFIDKIEELRHNTYSRITSVQNNICPMTKTIYFNHQYEYWYEGYKHTVWEDDTHIYAVNELPFCYDNELRNTTFAENLWTLIQDGKVWPFLLFINGLVIQWSKITVIHDYDYTYLRVDDIESDESFYTDIIVFPLHYNQIRYGEDRDIIIAIDRKGFYFDTEGKRLETTDFVDISLRFEILDQNIYYKEVNLNSLTGTTLEFTNLDDGFIPTLNNIILFNSDGTFNHTGSSEKIGNIYNSMYGLFNVLQTNSTAKWAILMYNTANTSKESSFLYSKEDLNRESIVKLLTENDKEEKATLWEEVITPLIQVFDFDHTFGQDYDTNLSNAAKYITRYDFRLWKDVMREDCNIQSYTYTGVEFKNLADTKGYVHFSRKYGEVIEDVAMMFINHKLYYYSLDITYTTNTINFPIFGILDDDHVEILVFNECNNNILEINVANSTTPIYIHPEYNLEDCYLMSEVCPDATYEVEDDPDGRKQYIVDFTYTINEDLQYLITFTNSYYYEKTLKVVPKKQFRYYRFKQKQGQYKIILPTQFNYCHDPNRYLVFVNGKKIDRTEYTITIMNPDRPFDKLILYLSTILDTGDYVDIFYIPEEFTESYKQSTIPKSGLILLEDTSESINYPTTYPLSKYTSLVFINGLKVNPLDIKDVSLNCMLLDMDKYVRDENGNKTYDGEGQVITKPYYVDSINNLTIMTYLDGDKEIAGYLKGLYEQIPEGQEYDPELIDFEKSASDAWKDLIKIILTKYNEGGEAYVGLKMLFGNIYEIETPAEDYKTNYANLKSILYDIVRDYYLDRSDVSTGDKFVYDFEREHFDPEDESIDTTKIITEFPDHDKLLDYEVTDNIATTSDVLAGQKFYSA